MNRDELNTLINSGQITDLAALADLAETDIETYDERLVIKNRVAFPVKVDCSSFDTEYIEIKKEDNATVLGVLCILHNRPVNLPRLTDEQLSAYLTEIREIDYNQPYDFKNDYFVLDRTFYDDYKNNYLESAPIWGNFIHLDRIVAHPIIKHTESTLIAETGLKLPTDYHKTALQRAIETSHPYDRFLKLYHQLELLFDWIVVRQIKNMGDDLSDFGIIFSRYGSGDMPRLKHLLHTYCHDDSSVDSIVEVLKLVRSHNVVAEKMFQEMGKKDNPLKEELAWNRFLNMLNNLTPRDKANEKEIKFAPNGDKYNTKILEITAYWIYRMRCCIAHFKIGEYLLPETEHAFIVNFGEPLLKMVIVKLLGNPGFHALF